MIKHHEPNPLAVFNLRRLDFCPIHFEHINFDIRTDEKNILDWIYENTEGRFFLGDVIAPQTVFSDRHSTVSYVKKSAGFEVHSEASYFALMLDTVNKFNNNF